MRISSILISGAVAAVAVAGSASASVVLKNLAQGTFVDDFQQSQTYSASANFVAWTPNPNALFGTTTGSGSSAGTGFTRQLARSSPSAPGQSGTIGSGNFTVVNPPWVLVPGVSSAIYQQVVYGSTGALGASKPTADLSGLLFSFTVTGFSASAAPTITPSGLLPNNVVFSFSTMDTATYTNGPGHVASFAITGNGTYTFWTAGWANMENVVQMTVSVGDNMTISNFTVPAPGAVALLGAAGLVGSRRRRN